MKMPLSRLTAVGSIVFFAVAVILASAIGQRSRVPSASETPQPVEHALMVRNTSDVYYVWKQRGYAGNVLVHFGNYLHFIPVKSPLLSSYRLPAPVMLTSQLQAYENALAYGNFLWIAMQANMVRYIYAVLPRENRSELPKANLVQKLFALLDKTLIKGGVILNKGKMFDASIVPIQRNSRQENQQIKEGDIPQEWKENPNKLRQKDVDAKWFKKNGQDYFGYKNHIKADKDSKLITAYQVTSANVHDSEMIDKLTSKKDAGLKLYADSAYRSEAIEQDLKKKSIVSCIHEKGYRNKPLTKNQQKRNNTKSKTRARVEHIFGFMTNSMHGMYIRCRNFVRAKATIGLMNITYNLLRLTQLKVDMKTI